MAQSFAGRFLKVNATKKAKIVEINLGSKKEEGLQGLKIWYKEGSHDNSESCAEAEERPEHKEMAMGNTKPEGACSDTQHRHMGFVAVCNSGTS